MAQYPARDKSPILSKRQARHATHKKSGSLNADNYNGVKLAESTANCGCSLKSFHDNLSSFAKPSKYKLSQIWPLFRHELAMPGALKKLDRGSSSCGVNAGGPNSLRRGFIRSPSPQHPARIKSPLFGGVSMQRDSYVEVSPRKPVDYLEEECIDNNNMHFSDGVEQCDDLIPMGMIVCTAKGSPCCTDTLHCRKQSGNGDLDDVEVDDRTREKLTLNKAVTRSRLGAPKRLRSTSPRSENLYTAVEREFKRLGIYKDHDSVRAPAYHREEEIDLSPSNNNSAETAELLEFSSQSIDDDKDYGFSLQQPAEEERRTHTHNTTHLCHRESEWQDHASMRGDPEPPECNHQEFVANQPQHYGYNHNDNHNVLHDYSCNGYPHSYASQDYEVKTQEGGTRLSAADTRISCTNVIERFVSLSNALSVTHFSIVIKKAETSIQMFTNYLVKARQKMMMKENPSHAPPHKHDLTASMIRPMMPNVKFDSRHHFKYGLQACVSKVIFDGFDTQRYGGEEAETGCETNRRQFMFLRAYYVLEALDTCDGEQLMEINGEFQQFCHRKLEAMKRRMGWESRWPSKLLQAFLCSLKDVWVAHKLAFAFERPACIFFAEPRSPLDLEHMNPLMESTSSKLSPNPKHMSPLLELSFTKLSPKPNPNPNLERVDRNYKTGYDISAFMDTSINPSPNPSSSPNVSPNLNLNPNPRFSPSFKKGSSKLVGYGKLDLIDLRWHGVVQFTAFPGFFLKEGVVHSIVYLQPKNPACVSPLHYPNFIL